MTRNQYERKENNIDAQDNEDETKQKVLKRDKKSGIEINCEGIRSEPAKNWDKYEKLDWAKEIERHRINLERKLKNRI